MSENSASDFHCGIVALVGRANTGKSTLINALLGEKVSIVSPVAQTTRNLVRGILTENNRQLVLLDTPGIHQASSPLGKIMNRSARASIEGADVILLVLDRASKPRPEDAGWLKKIGASGNTAIIVFNKQDLAVNYESEYIAVWREECPGIAVPETISISAADGKGTDRLREILFGMLPVSPPLFPEDILSDFPRRWAIADVIREKLYRGLRDELPHSVAVNVSQLDETAECIKVSADILVERPTQKPIIIGQKGRGLRRVKRAAEKELQNWFEVPVKLSLWVKVEPGWSRNHFLLKQLA